MKPRSIKVVAFLVALAMSATAQSGGDFVITQAVIASGGNQSSGGDFVLESTTGQPDAGSPIGSGPFAITPGFWVFTPLAPTAAAVSISGRVATLDGIGISNASVFLQSQNGEIFMSRSSAFGYYMFEGIAVGQSVFITVEHKRFTFEPRSIMVSDTVTDLDIVGVPNP